MVTVLVWSLLAAPPAAFLRDARALVVNEWCEALTEPAPLTTRVHVELDDGALLIFVQVPSYMCRQTNDALPVVIDAKGTWRWGKALDGEVQAAARASDGVLWAQSEWQIEGGYPIVWRSVDGITCLRVKDVETCSSCAAVKSAWTRSERGAAVEFRRGKTMVSVPRTLKPE